MKKLFFQAATFWVWVCAVATGEPVVRFHSTPTDEKTFSQRAIEDLKNPVESRIWDRQTAHPKHISVWPIAGQPGHYLVAAYWQDHMIRTFEPLAEVLDGLNIFNPGGSQIVGYQFTGENIEKVFRPLAGNRDFQTLAAELLAPLIQRHKTNYTLHITSWQSPLDRRRHYKKIVGDHPSERIWVDPLPRPEEPLFDFSIQPSKNIPLVRVLTEAVGVNELISRARRDVSGSVQEFIRQGSQNEPPLALVYPVQELPGVYALVAQTQQTLNNLMTRASIFAEGDSTLIPRGTLLPITHAYFPFCIAGTKGHDIRGRDLRLYAKALDQAGGFANSFERSFRHEVVGPLMETHGTEFVLLGISLQTASTDVRDVFWHELLHAQHFTNSELDYVLWKFWKENAPARDATLDALGALDYNTNIEALNVTEMYAYSFDPAARLPGRPAPLVKLVNACAEPLLAAVRSAGIEPITNLKRN